MTSQERLKTNILAAKKSPKALDKQESLVKKLEDRKQMRGKLINKNYEICDILDMRDPQSVAEFAPKITTYMMEQEKEYMVSPNYLKAK